jgi:N-methylhydantoinase B
MEAVMDYSERRMRAEIDAMPDGVYEARDWMEDTGTGGEPAEIAVKVTIDGSNIGFDYSGTSPQVEGPVNAPLGVTIAGIYYTLISITDPTIPVNDGCFRPITLQIPEGCMMNPVRPAPVAGGNVETSQRNVDVLMRAFAQVVPDRVPAAGLGTMNNVCIGGVDEDGAPWTFYETIGGGHGARVTKDGVDGIHCHMTNTMNTPVEALEIAYPFVVTRYQLIPNTGGPGKFRGGLGIRREYLIFDDDASFSILAERRKTAPYGLFGGKDGAPGRDTLIEADDNVPEKRQTLRLPGKTTRTLHRGQRIVIQTPGGGGYGDPYLRDPELVLRDVLEGRINADHAEEFYGVVITGERIDEEATRRLRGSG